jgi:hypothetical protein
MWRSVRISIAREMVDGRLKIEFIDECLWVEKIYFNAEK